MVGQLNEKGSTRGCRDLSGRGHGRSGAERAEFSKVEEMQLSRDKTCGSLFFKNSPGDRRRLRHF